MSDRKEFKPGRKFSRQKSDTDNGVAVWGILSSSDGVAKISGQASPEEGLLKITFWFSWFGWAEVEFSYAAEPAPFPLDHTAKQQGCGYRVEQAWAGSE